MALVEAIQVRQGLVLSLQKKTKRFQATILML